MTEKTLRTLSLSLFSDATYTIYNNFIRIFNYEIVQTNMY